VGQICLAITTVTSSTNPIITMLPNLLSNLLLLLLLLTNYIVMAPIIIISSNGSNNIISDICNHYNTN